MSESTPRSARSQITFQAGLQGLATDGRYKLRARISDQGRQVTEFTGPTFSAGDVEGWPHDVHGVVEAAQAVGHQHARRTSMTPRCRSSMRSGQVVDTAMPVRFGFREFWIEGRDFYLNGTRLVPVVGARWTTPQVGAALATYAAAKESFLRLKSFGINFVYTHNYGCEPGSHLSFAEILRAADDTGMLVALSQPHFSAYDWKTPDADQTNGYARHAAFYVRVAGSHPSVVAYAMSHNATGYNEDIESADDRRPERSAGRVGRTQCRARVALRSHRQAPGPDANRLSSLLGQPERDVHAQFLSQLRAHARNWTTGSSTGQPPGSNRWSWSSTARRSAGTGPCTAAGITASASSAAPPCRGSIASPNGTPSFSAMRPTRSATGKSATCGGRRSSSAQGRGWYRWDYPYPVGDARLDEMQPVQAAYTTDNWRAFRTWGLSGNSPWEHDRFWKLRDGFQHRRAGSARGLGQSAAAGLQPGLH